MESRVYEWTSHYAEGSPAAVTIRLEHADVGDVRGTLRIVGAPNGGPYEWDELESLAETILAAAAMARRWSEETSR